MISSLYTKYPHLAKVFFHHPGLVPILGAQEETLAKLTRAAATNQAAKVTVRDARILEGYDPAAKAEETFRPPLKIAANLTTWDPEQQRFPDIRVHDRQREAAEDALNKETADRLYSERHPEPGEVLTETLPTAEELRVPEIAGEAEVLSALAQTAHSAARSPYPTEEQLVEEPELAQWLSRDRGEITAEMRDWGKTVVDRDATQTWELLRERIAEEAAGWFAAGSPLDRKFFRENPEAALYLKEHPALRKDLDRHHDRAGKFAAEFARIHERLEPELVQRAAQRAESPGMFNERFFRDHRELALLSETARSVLGAPGPADLFVGAEQDEDFNQRTLAAGVESLLSKERLKATGKGTLKVPNHLWFQRLVNRSESFTANLAAWEKQTNTSERVDPIRYWLELAGGIDPDLPGLTHTRLEA